MNKCCQIEGKKTCPHSQYSCWRSLTPDNKVESKVDRCLSNIAIPWKPIFEWYVVGVDLRTDTKKASYVSKRLACMLQMC